MHADHIMDYAEIFSRVSRVTRKVFEDPDMTIGDHTSANDVDLWNSLNHVVLISELEKEFKIQFGLTDMIEISTIGDICRKIQSLTSS